MLAKRFRLPIQLFVAKKGKILKTPYFLLKIFKAETADSRFGVTVSVKTASKATGRNRIKRAVYNFLRENGKRLLIADYWISVLPGSGGLPKDKFMEELSKLF